MKAVVLPCSTVYAAAHRVRRLEMLLPMAAQTRVLVVAGGYPKCERLPAALH